MSRQDALQQDFTEQSVKFYEQYNVGYLDLAMRFGKCKTTIQIVKELFDFDCTILIAYPDNKLKDTWQNELKLWKYKNPNITFVNFSSVYKFENKIFDFFIVDEFHSASDNEREICLEIIKSSKKAICLSGTVTQDTVLMWGVREIGKYSTSQGIKDGILADYTITVHLVELDNKIKTKNSKGLLKTEKEKYKAYSAVIERLQYENKPFFSLALARNRLSLNSIGKLNYLKNLLSDMEEKRVVVFTGLTTAADSVGIPSYHSKSPSDKNFLDFQKKKINHLALAAMGKLGVSYVDLDSVILTNFTYNAEESSQILNRAIKLDYKGKIADLHVLCLNEPAERKKVKASLSMLDQTKIKYK